MVDKVIPGCILMTFHDKQEGMEILKQNKLNSLSVSCLVPRYSVDVPWGEEKKWNKYFSNCDAVKQIHGVIYGERIYKKIVRSK